MKTVMTIKSTGGQRTFYVKNKKMEQFKEWAKENGYQIIRTDEANDFEDYYRAYITNRKNRF